MIIEYNNIYEAFFSLLSLLLDFLVNSAPFLIILVVTILIAGFIFKHITFQK